MTEQHPDTAKPAWWMLVISFFVGLATFGAGVDVMTGMDLPAVIGAPVCIGLMSFGLMLAIASVGVLIEQPDSDGSPEGRDANAARSRSDESAGRKASAQAQRTTTATTKGER